MIKRLSKAFTGKVTITEFPQEHGVSIAPNAGHSDHHSFLPSPHMTSKFEALDDDSIYLILVALCYTDVTRRLKQLWPLSLTCKRLRQLCLPLMFKRVMWPNKHIPNVDEDVPMYPETLWPYIQYVNAGSTYPKK